MKFQVAFETDWMLSNDIRWFWDGRGECVTSRRGRLLRLDAGRKDDTSLMDDRIWLSLEAIGARS